MVGLKASAAACSVQYFLNRPTTRNCISVIRDTHLTLYVSRDCHIIVADDGMSFFTDLGRLAMYHPRSQMIGMVKTTAKFNFLNERSSDFRTTLPAKQLISPTSWVAKDACMSIVLDVSWHDGRHVSQSIEGLQHDLGQMLSNLPVGTP